MMSKIFRLIVWSFGVFLNVGAQLIAQEKVSISDANHLTAAEEMAIHTQRLAYMPEELLSDSLLHTNLQFQYYDDSDYLYRIHLSAYYYTVAITSSGDRIQLHDASLWAVNPSKREVIKTWVGNDPLFIKPNAACFSFYRYVLQNRTTRDIVPVNLVEEPLANCAYTHLITGIDYYNRLVYLSNDTVWRVNPNDFAFSKWRPQQKIIIGVNNNWRVAAYPHILINASLSNAPYCEANLAY